MNKYRITLKEQNGEKQIVVEHVAESILHAINFAMVTHPGFEAISGCAYVENVDLRQNPEFYASDWNELMYILSGALYGSSWASADYNKEDKLKYKKDGHDCYEDILADILLGGGKILITDNYELEDAEDEEEEKAAEHWLGLEDFRQALITLKEGFPRTWGDLVDEQADYCTYDTILQLACFKELVYG